MTDSSSLYYRAADTVVRQGDFVRCAPNFLLLKTLEHVGQREKSQHGTKGFLLPHDTVPEKISKNGGLTSLVVPAHFSWMMLLTRGCDIDKGHVRQLVPRKPLTEIQEDERKADLINGKFNSLLYLPEMRVSDTEVVAEGFLDFRSIVSVKRELFDQLARPIGLTHGLLQTIYLGWIRHASGTVIPTHAECSGCGAAVPVFHVVQDAVTPPDDF